MSDWRARAESAEAELRALRGGLEALADEKCTDPENHTTCVSACFRALLATSPAATTGDRDRNTDQKEQDHA